MSIGDVSATITPMGWQEVADAVVNRRVELGMRTRKQLADASGLTVKTLGEIERAERTSYDPATLAVVEQALKWPVGTIADIRGKPAIRVGDSVISKTPEGQVVVEHIASDDPDDDPDPLQAKLERLQLLAHGLNPTDARRLADNVQMLLEWANARHGVPEMTDEEREQLETFQRTTRAISRRQRAAQPPAAAEHLRERQDT